MIASQAHRNRASSGFARGSIRPGIGFVANDTLIIAFDREVVKIAYERVTISENLVALADQILGGAVVQAIGEFVSAISDLGGHQGAAGKKNGDLQKGLHRTKLQEKKEPLGTD
eukprot:TRINITY_DN1687_c1_g1_i1.p3 TRINITY_DN1687_c1_g1~~TRINITY_DN1687_c1_g1_i1.p3  ORF type:complete len:114 (-),score=6.31 TRINITY_DN1687_c1_g1_i1:4-345(-)